jgi:hypothetical protein
MAVHFLAHVGLQARHVVLMRGGGR